LIMIKKNDVKTTVQIHSQAKLEFYEAYLNRYLRILCHAKPIKRINIYDVFCGMGIYDDGGKGSPIIAFDIIKNILLNENLRKTGTQISLVVNDKDLQKIERVKKYIELNNKENICKVEYYNNDIEQMFDIIKKEVACTVPDTRNIIFIDPYGYKNIKKEILYQLMDNHRTEIILFLPISHMHRFTQKAIHDEEAIQYEPLRIFIASFFDASHRMAKEQLHVMDYIDFITEALKFGEFHAVSYYIERDAANYFALFFISSHIYGFEKILEVKWQLDEDAGRGFRIPPMQKDLFETVIAEEEKERNVAKLEAILSSFLAEPKDNKQVYEETLKHGFLPKHAVEVFTKWKSISNDFKIYNIKTKVETKKGGFYISHTNYNENPKVLFRKETHENNKN